MPPGAKAKLTVTKGKRIGKTYVIQEGVNYIGKTGQLPVNIDLDDQEKPCTAAERHAIIYLEKGSLAIADTKTPNGTMLNNVRIQPGKKFLMKAEDVIQIGTVALQIKILLKKKTAAQK